MFGAAWSELDNGFRASPRAARPPCIRPARSPYRLESADVLTGAAGRVVLAPKATTPAPTTAVVTTAAYRLRGGVGTRRRPRERPRGGRWAPHTPRHRRSETVMP